MKKILPFFCLLLFGASIVQVITQGSETSASFQTKKIEHKTFISTKLKSLKVETITGEAINFDSETPIILNFWASWCRPCISEFKSLNKLIGEYGEKIKVIGINNDEENPLKTIKKIENKYGLKFPSMADPKSSIASELNIQHIPSTIVIHKGKARFVHEGEFDFTSTSFKKTIDQFIK